MREPNLTSNNEESASSYEASESECEENISHAGSIASTYYGEESAGIMDIGEESLDIPERDNR